MRVIGVGDNVVDRYTNRRIMFPGGNAVNFAVYAKQCGADSAYLGLIADEPEGRLVRDSLEKMGVDVSMSPLREGMTTERCDVKLEDGDRVFIGTEYGEGTWEPLRLTEEHLAYLEQFDLVHCGCYAEMADQIRRLAGLAGVKTFDFSEEPEYRTEEYLNKVCPYIDIALFSGAETDEEQRQQIREKATALGTEFVLITDGSRGQTLWDGERIYPGKVKRVDAVDTMGAGDSFFTAFVIELLRQGYRRGAKLTADRYAAAFDYAAGFSAKTCLEEGAFGFGTAY
ncbi:MAG: ribokinase [Firmicutes bacterium]|nr:ribokinase [Bacillota bacterium]